jgi:hypothetical protein
VSRRRARAIVGSEGPAASAVGSEHRNSGISRHVLRENGLEQRCQVPVPYLTLYPRPDDGTDWRQCVDLRHHVGWPQLALQLGRELFAERRGRRFLRRHGPVRTLPVGSNEETDMNGESTAAGCRRQVSLFSIHAAPTCGPLELCGPFAAGTSWLTKDRLLDVVL